MSRFLFSGTGNIIFGALKIGKNNPEITNLVFENHENNFFHVFLPTEQAGTNICSMVYQDINFKICLSLFGWKENILPNVHIVHCTGHLSIICDQPRFYKLMCCPQLSSFWNRTLRHYWNERLTNLFNPILLMIVGS